MKGLLKISHTVFLSQALTALDADKMRTDEVLLEPHTA